VLALQVRASGLLRRRLGYYIESFRQILDHLSDAGAAASRRLD